MSKIPTPIQDRVNLDKYIQKYTPMIKSAEGKLAQLTEIKRQLTKDATSLSPEIFDPMTGQVINTAKEAEAKYLKQASGIVRQHIEDLAATVDPKASQAISNTNKTIGNLITARDGIEKTMNRKGGVISPTEVLGSTAIGLLSHSTPAGLAAFAGKKALEAGTGHTMPRLGKIAGAKGLKTLATGMQKVEKVTGQVVKKTGLEDASKFLYNASADTLKGIGNKLSSTPGMEDLGIALNRAIENNDTAKRSAVLFVILQKPETRALLNEFSGGSQE
jgi:hypothetical protein